MYNASAHTLINWRMYGPIRHQISVKFQNNLLKTLGSINLKPSHK